MRELNRLLADFERTVRDHVQRPTDTRWQRMEMARQRLIGAVTACAGVLERLVANDDWLTEGCRLCGAQPSEARCRPGCIRRLALQALSCMNADDAATPAMPRTSHTD